MSAARLLILLFAMPVSGYCLSSWIRSVAMSQYVEVKSEHIDRERLNDESTEMLFTIDLDEVRFGTCDAD